jgi:hypothetical protein
MEVKFWPTTALTLRTNKLTGREVPKLSDGSHVYTFKRVNMHGQLAFYCANSAHLANRLPDSFRQRIKMRGGRESKNHLVNFHGRLVPQWYADQQPAAEKKAEKETEKETRKAKAKDPDNRSSSSSTPVPKKMRGGRESKKKNKVHLDPSPRPPNPP